MIDLHTHTKYSDGTWTVSELLENAEKKKITLLSITDHNSVGAHLEMRGMDINKYFSGVIISGVEFDTIFDDVKIELLGYNFDIDKLYEWINKTYNFGVFEYYKEEFNNLVNLCKEKGVRLSENLIYKEGYPYDIVFNDIKLYDENKIFFTDEVWNDKEAFYRKCTCDKSFIFYSNFSYLPTAKEVSKSIREAGGKVFLAHLYTYPLIDYIEYLNELKNSGIIDGIEVYYSNFTDEQIELLKEYCIKNNLYMSGGTDCHGEKKKEREIGTGYGNMKVEEDIVSDWIKY